MNKNSPAIFILLAKKNWLDSAPKILYEQLFWEIDSAWMPERMAFGRMFELGKYDISSLCIGYGILAQVITNNWLPLIFE